MQNIDVVILCGGLGKRLRDVTGEAPKVMVEVEGQPFLDKIMGYLKNQGLQRVILCTGYQADVIEEYYKKNSQGLEIIFSREEHPLGTGGALKNARDFIQSDMFFMMNGDSFCPVDFKNFFEFYQHKSGVAALAISEVDESKDFGGIVMDQENRILGFYEKQESNTHVNAGVYCLSQKVFESMPEKENFSMEYDLFPKLVEKNIYGFLVEENFFDIGTPERLEKARKEM